MDVDVTRPAPQPGSVPTRLVWLRPPPDWRKSALCRDSDPDTFYPAGEDGDINRRQIRQAKSICGGCTVWRSCLADAVTTENSCVHGVRGGLSAREREPLVRDHLAAKARGAGKPPLVLDGLSAAARSALLAVGTRDRIDPLTPRGVKSELLRAGLCDEAVGTSRSATQGGVRANQEGRKAIREWLDAEAARVAS